MQDQLEQLLKGRTLGMEEAQSLLTGILDTQDLEELKIAVVLALIEARGVTTDELTGFRLALVDRIKRISLGPVLDLCGTGGDRKNTFNISTLSAFVVAGAGYRVAKHGNFSSTSKCGSSDVLQAAGVSFFEQNQQLQRSLDRAGICVLHAPLFQPSLAKLSGIRKRLGFRTIFNLLGPLMNPAFPSSQMIGVNDSRTLRIYGSYLQRSEQRWLLVHSFDGYDEISLTGQFIVRGSFMEEVFYPEDLGWSRCSPGDLLGGETTDEALSIFNEVLAGRASQPKLDVVIANASFGMLATDPELSLQQAIARATESLLGGAAQRAFNILSEV